MPILVSCLFDQIRIQADRSSRRFPLRSKLLSCPVGWTYTDHASSLSRIERKFPLFPRTRSADSASSLDSS